jgi:hypothetical protein
MPKMPPVKLPQADLKPAHVKAPSPALTKFLQYVMGIPGIQPTCIDDAADILDYQDVDLAQICGNGDPELDEVLREELDEMEICLPSDHCGWLVDILGGKLDESPLKIKIKAGAGEKGNAKKKKKRRELAFA